MSNTYFQFKKFRIEQDQCAMKVCTDSCILGAFTNPSEANRILDIGTGTGLLALMLSQKSNAIIDAIEIEENAFHQAKNNFLKSPWSERLNIIHGSIQNFSAAASNKYDLIISNPPFFTNQLKSFRESKNIAHHNEALSFKELTKAVSKLLNPQGKFAVLLPAYEFQLLKEDALTLNLHVNEVLKIKDKESLPLIRIISIFSFSESSIKESELIIKNSAGEYTEEFKLLMKEYYLNI